MFEIVTKLTVEDVPPLTVIVTPAAPLSVSLTVAICGPKPGPPSCSVTGEGVIVGRSLQVFRRIETFWNPLLAVAKSCLPLLLKSPITRDRGALPTLTSGINGVLKEPSPFPSRIDTWLELRLAVAKS